MRSDHVERRDRGFWIAGTRVSLDSIVYVLLNDQTAESIIQSFPILRLEQVYGAVGLCLANLIASRLTPTSRLGVARIVCVHKFHWEEPGMSRIIATSKPKDPTVVLEEFKSLVAERRFVMTSYIQAIAFY